MLDTNQILITAVLCWIASFIVIRWCRPARCMVADEKESSKKRLCNMRCLMCALFLTLMFIAIMLSVQDVYQERRVSSFGFYY